MYICVQKCDELDYDGYVHCSFKSREELDFCYERYPDGCPVGNKPIWEESVESEVLDECEVK